MESHDYLRFVLALAFVLALMGIFAQLAKKFGWGKGMALGRANKRLSVIEIRPLDARHKLVLVKCDEREHLLMLSPEQSSVIESRPAAKEPL